MCMACGACARAGWPVKQGAPSKQAGSAAWLSLPGAWACASMPVTIDYNARNGSKRVNNNLEV
jgi:hypothetical protein